MSKKIQIGDIVEIKTSKGFSYAQLTHIHQSYSALIRILPGLFAVGPSNFNNLASQKQLFFAFIPLQTAVNRGIFKVVANCPVPEFAKDFPLFKVGIPSPTTGKIEVWWLWDGEKEWKVGKLNKDQISLPMRGIWNDTLLIERIESGWNPMEDIK